MEERRRGNGLPRRLGTGPLQHHVVLPARFEEADLDPMEPPFERDASGLTTVSTRSRSSSGTYSYRSKRPTGLLTAPRPFLFMWNKLLQ